MLFRNKQFNNYYNIKWREWLNDQNASQIAFIKSKKTFHLISVFARLIVGLGIDINFLI